MNKKLYLPITATLAIIALVLFPDFVFAGDYGLTATAKTAGLAGESDLSKIVGNIIGTALSMISVLFFALILYGGFLWMTSRGNSDQENKAKDTIFGAVVGIIIILAAYAITNFVFTNLGPGAGGGSAPTTPTANTGSSGSSSSSGGSGSSGTAKGECPDDTDCKSDFSGSSKNPPKVDGKEKAPDKKSTNSCKNTSECAAGNYCAGATKNAQIGGKCQPKLGTGADCKVDSHESCKSGNCAMSSSKGEIVAKCQ